MSPSASKKPPAKPPLKKPTAAPAPAARRPGMVPEDAKTLPLKGKKVLGPKNAPPPKPPTEAITTAVPATPAPEAAGNDKQLCWIELVKNGNMFIARSNITGGSSKEYKNRILEDMLTELIVELQEDIQE